MRSLTTGPTCNPGGGRSGTGGAARGDRGVTIPPAILARADEVIQRRRRRPVPTRIRGRPRAPGDGWRHAADACVWLEAETPEETAALQACAARGEWTNGRGAEAVQRLHALSARLGYPIKAPSRPPRAGSACLVVVRPGDRELYEGLLAIVRDSVAVIRDRRTQQRRTTDRLTVNDRRRQDRRQPPPATWTSRGFLVVPIEDTPE